MSFIDMGTSTSQCSKAYALFTKKKSTKKHKERAREKRQRKGRLFLIIINFKREYNILCNVLIAIRFLELVRTNSKF